MRNKVDDGMSYKRRQIQRGLLNNSTAAYYAAIELHNKPNVKYRYETTTLLMLNAWELLLKAYVRKYTNSDIFIDEGKTITCSKAIDLTLQSMSGEKLKSFRPVAENLRLLESYRNEFAHYYRDDLDAAIFALLAKSSLSYLDFQKEYFPSFHFLDENLYILPLGFKLPFAPEMLFDRFQDDVALSSEATDFIANIAKVSANLEAEGIEESILVGFDIHLNSVKAVKNADIVAKLDNDGLPLSSKKHVRITDDPSAAPVKLTEDDFFTAYPMTYADLTRLCSERIEGFLSNQRYHSIRKKYVLGNPLYSAPRSQNPDKSNARVFYREAAVDIIKEHWNE